MTRVLVSTLLATVLASSGTVARAQSTAADSLGVEVVRFYRAGADTNQPLTMVKAFVEVPYAALAGAAAADSLRYQVTMRVLDSTGLKLLEETWGKAVPAAAAQPGVSGLEIAEFALVPGNYRFEVVASNLQAGKSLQRSVELHGYDAMPGASDLLLSPQMRIADSTDTVPRPGELRRGNTMVTATSHLRLTPERSAAFYLLEAYTNAAQEQSGTMVVSIVDSTGTALVQTSPAPVRILPGGGILKGQLALTGLPEGEYQLKVDVAVNGDTMSRAETFSMAGLSETLARAQAAARPAVDERTDAGYFAAMEEAELDAAFAPLEYIASSRELRPYDEQLSVDAKRRFLTQFWQSRDPNEATPINEARVRFYAAIAFANRQYGEAVHAGRPGWKTDRGRIYAKNGVPDDVLQRPRQGQSPPYEVWRYTSGRPRYYVFADRTGFGDYQLIHTDDRNEVGVPNWIELLTLEAVEDIGRFVNEDFTGGFGGVGPF